MVNDKSKTGSAAPTGSSPSVSGEKRFAVMQSYEEKGKHASSVPWSLVEPHEGQAQRNHYQSLERLNQRGGLSVVELWHVVNDQNWAGAHHQGARITYDDAVKWLENVLAPQGQPDTRVTPNEP